MNPDDVQSVLNLIELDLRAAAERYLAEFGIQEIDGVWTISPVNGEATEDAADRLAAEVGVIAAFHAPPGVRYSYEFTMHAMDGTEITRRIEGQAPLGDVEVDVEVGRG